MPDVDKRIRRFRSTTTTLTMDHEQLLDVIAAKFSEHYDGRPITANDVQLEGCDYDMSAIVRVEEEEEEA